MAPVEGCVLGCGNCCMQQKRCVSSVSHVTLRCQGVSFGPKSKWGRLAEGPLHGTNLPPGEIQWTLTSSDGEALRLVFQAEEGKEEQNHLLWRISTATCPSVGTPLMIYQSNSTRETVFSSQRRSSLPIPPSNPSAGKVKRPKTNLRRPAHQSPTQGRTVMILVITCQPSGA
jgi:hypothetical protein